MISADDDGAEGRDYDFFYDQLGRLTETKWRAADQVVPYNYNLINKYTANSQRSERIVQVTGDPGPAHQNLAFPRTVSK
jgi:YD repeat-containing protein